MFLEENCYKTVGEYDDKRKNSKNIFIFCLEVKNNSQEWTTKNKG